MSSRHTNTQQSISSKTQSLKPGLKQIGRNIIDPSIRTEEEDDFMDSNYQRGRNTKQVNNHGTIEVEDDLTGSDDEEQIEIDQQLQENVIKYTNYYDLLKEKKKEIAEIRKAMDEPKKLIIQFCNKAGVGQLNVTDGKLIKNVSKKKKSLKENIIKEAISKRIPDQNIVQAILEDINNIRVNTEDSNVTLKRTYNRS